jgi:hypothetical protein
MAARQPSDADGVKYTVDGAVRCGTEGRESRVVGLGETMTEEGDGVGTEGL